MIIDWGALTNKIKTPPLTHPNQYERIYADKFPRNGKRMINLSPGTEAHQVLLQRILERFYASNLKLSNRRNDWTAIDRNLTAYVSPDIKAEIEADTTRDIPIIIPVSYAALETLVAYMSAAFLDNPIFQYEGFDDKDIIGALLLQKVINMQVIRNKVPLNLRIGWRDGFAYGFGAMATTWKTVNGYKWIEPPTNAIAKVLNMFGIPYQGAISEPQRELTRLFEGNALENIDPRLFYPDPNVSLHRLQDGEFVGWVRRINKMTVLEQEVSPGDTHFNGNYVKHMTTDLMSVFYIQNAAERSGKSTLGTTQPAYVSEAVDELNIYIKIIPADWDLSPITSPEIWRFAVLGDTIVTMAEPSGQSSNKFPIVVSVPDDDGYSITPISRLETFFGMQQQVDWFISSHVANVRKSINDMIVYDPMMIDMNDLENPGPGGLIKLLSGGWGTGKITDYIQQLNVRDVTQNHMSDLVLMSELIKDYMGTTDNVMGNRRKSGERVTATEVNQLTKAGLSKLDTTAKIIDLMMMMPIGEQFVFGIQDFMEDGQYVKIVGEWEQQLLREYQTSPTRAYVSPRDLSGYYDVLPKTNSMPGTEDPNTWLQLLPLLDKGAGNAIFDMPRILLHIMRQMGVRNAEDFLVKGQVRENEAVQQQVQQGNLIPIGEASGQQ